MVVAVEVAAGAAVADGVVADGVVAAGTDVAHDVDFANVVGLVFAVDLSVVVVLAVVKMVADFLHLLQ